MSGGGARKIAGQGALLTGAFVTSQAASFARNAILGHWLAKGDFGIAALITLTLQLVEILSDLAADRLIVQDADGEAPCLMATLHTVQVARGVLLALVLFIAGPFVAALFAVPAAAAALQVMAVVPLLKGFQHLDVRRSQRRLDNRAFAIVEAAPQVLALALTVPVLLAWPGFGVVVWLALAQALAAVALSHALAERRYAIALDRAVLVRLARFSWPIWLSAIPLVAVYQGDRLIVGRVLGIEALAAYSAVFMLAMVPGLLAAKVGQSLMLPLLAEVRDAPDRLAARYRAMVAIVVAWAAAYLAGFVVAGGALSALAFGSNYTGLGALAGWLALMWAVRMVQAVPGMALMTLGDTRPLLTAGTLRALPLLPAGLAAMAGHGLEVIAGIGVAGEIASLGWLALALERLRSGLGQVLLSRTLLLVPVAGIAALLAGHVTAGLPAPLILLLGVAAAIAAGVIVAGLTFALDQAARRLLFGQGGRLTPMPVAG